MGNQITICSYEDFNDAMRLKERKEKGRAFIHDLCEVIVSHHVEFESFTYSDTSVKRTVFLTMSAANGSLTLNELIEIKKKLRAKSLLVCNRMDSKKLFIKILLR